MTTEQTIVATRRPDTARNRSIGGHDLGLAFRRPRCRRGRGYRVERARLSRCADWQSGRHRGAPARRAAYSAYDHWLAGRSRSSRSSRSSALSRLRVGMAQLWAAPLHPDGPGDHDHRLARPDDELGALRRVQPAAVALARVMAAGFALSDHRTIRRLRLCDVSVWTVLSGRLGAAQDSGPAAADAFVWRHPLISLGVLIFVFGFIIDMILRSRCPHRAVHLLAGDPVRLDLCGHAYQFPLLWESSLVTLVMIPAGILVYRDDTGRTVSEKLAQRADILPDRPVLGSFLVMLVIVNVFYLVYGLTFTALKWSRHRHVGRLPMAVPRRQSL